MKQSWNKLVNNLLGKLGKALLGIACLHEMGASLLEAGNFFTMVDSNQEEAHYMAGVARLKSEDGAVYSKQAR